MDNRRGRFIVAPMNGNELAVFALLLLAGGLVNYRYAEPIAAAFRRWVPECWDSEPACQRLAGQLMSASGVVLFAAARLAA